jgi:hypothetical protein
VTGEAENGPGSVLSCAEALHCAGSRRRGLPGARLRSPSGSFSASLVRHFFTIVAVSHCRQPFTVCQSLTHLGCGAARLWRGGGLE